MIKIHKRIERYAAHFTVTAAMEYENPNIETFLKKESIKKLKVPDNTLKIIFIRSFKGYHGDDFIKNQKTFAFYYNIITFKR